MLLELRWVKDWKRIVLLRAIWRQVLWVRKVLLFPVKAFQKPQILFLAFPDATGDEVDERLIVPLVGIEQRGDVVATDDRVRLFPSRALLE